MTSISKRDRIKSNESVWHGDTTRCSGLHSRHRSPRQASPLRTHRPPPPRVPSSASVCACARRPTLPCCNPTFDRSPTEFTVDSPPRHRASALALAPSSGRARARVFPFGEAAGVSTVDRAPHLCVPLPCRSRTPGHSRVGSAQKPIHSTPTPTLSTSVRQLDWTSGGSLISSAHRARAITFLSSPASLALLHLCISSPPCT